MSYIDQEQQYADATYQSSKARFAQSFVPSVGSISSVDIKTCVWGNMVYTVSIREERSGSSLIEKSLESIDLPACGDIEWISFVFDSPLELIAGETYWIVVDIESAGGTFKIGYGVYDSYLAGDCYKWDYIFHSWKSFGAMNDLTFRTYSEEVPIAPCEDYTTQDDCESAGCYWYDDVCHPIPQPSPEPPINILPYIVVGTLVVGLIIIGRK